LSTCSRYLAETYVRRYPSVQTEVVTNGVDTQIYRPRWEQVSEVAALKQKLGIAADRKLVLFVGRISPEKGPLDLVRAFEMLRTRRPDTLLLLVGEYRTTGKPGDRRADYGRQVVDACQRLGADCIMTGVVEPGEVQRYYPLGDLLVVPSEFEEPFGMVAIEGMAAGVPVLAARRGGLPEFVLPGQTGYRIDDTKNASALASQIDAILSSPDEMQRIAVSARAYVETHHDWTTVAPRLESFYARLLKA
jgi:glycosyltransferase involved in cell wall biosynthesis